MTRSIQLQDVPTLIIILPQNMTPDPIMTQLDTVTNELEQISSVLLHTILRQMRA